MKVTVRPSGGWRVAGISITSELSPPRLALSVLLVWFAAAGPAAFAQGSPEIFREIPAANLSSAAGTSDLEGPSVVRSRYVEIDLQRILPQLEPAHAAPSRARGTSPRRLTFNLFADTVQEFELERGEYSADRSSYSWFGRAAEDGGQAVLVVRDGTVAGSVRTASGDFYRIRSVNSQVHRIRQVVYQGTPPVQDAIPVPESEIPQAAYAQQDAPVAEQAGATTLDVMVVYTAGARQAAGGTAGIQSEIQLAIAELNQSFSNSGVQMQARLAHSAEVAYSDEQAGLSTTLARLRSPSDGYVDQVHSLRNQYGADVVALLVNGPGASGGTVGVGYIMQTVGSYFADYAFSVTEVNFATGPSYALLHEIGHNLGAAHDRDHSSTPGAYPYSYGYQRSSTPRFRTIMSYNCSGVNCPTVAHWSNPNVNHQGYPTGIASSQSNSADNRQTLNNTKATAAAWRQGTSMPNSAPTVGTITPSSGSGQSQTFSASFFDPDGASNLRYTYILMNSGLSWTGSCGLRYDRLSNLLQVINDQGSGWQGGISPGSGSLANSQCTVSGSGFSVSLLGNTLTQGVAVNFAAGFAGTKSVYLNAADNSDVFSGWVQRGAWTVPSGGGSSPAPPTANSVSPSSGSGSSQTFTAQFADGNGASDIRYTYVLMNSGLTWTGSCGLRYDRVANRLEIINDQGSGWQGSISPGSGSLSNNQCTVNGLGFSISSSGNTLTQTFAATFKSAFSGSKAVYLNVSDSGGAASGWYQRGSWTVPGGGGSSPVAPTSVSITPSSGTGSSQSFSAQFSDGNGASDIRYTYVLMNSGLTWVGSCGLRYDRTSNVLQIINNQGSGWQGGISPGSGTLSNNNCTVSGSGFSVSAAGNTLTQTFPITFSDSFAGAKAVYLVASDMGGNSGSWAQRGTWTAPSGSGTGGSPVAPTADSISPSSGSGTSQTFTARFSDGNGATDLRYTYVLMNSGLTWVGSCGLRYDRAANLLQVINDQGSGWQGGITPGSGALSNSRCTVHGSGFSTSTSGNTLNVTFTSTFASSFQGDKNVYIEAVDNTGTFAGWRFAGYWTVP
jgi:hypothetical protein